MPLTLVIGPANSAKAGEVLGAYGAAARRGALLVVPNADDAEHYGRELAGTRAILGSVLTFTGLVAELARRAGYRGRLLTPLQRRHVLRRAVARARLDGLAESSRSAGFAGAAGELFAELGRAMVTAQRWTQALEQWSRADPRRAAYAQELARLYRAYCAELDRIGRVDAELHVRRALDALRADPRRWGGSPVFLYGFDDLDRLQRDAVETLARVAGAEVTVSLSYEPGRDAFAARAEAVEELRPLAARVIELPALDTHYAPDSRVALHHVERWLFERPPDVVDPGDTVRLLEAGGELAEAELVAGAVLERLRAGVPGGEIAVVTRTPEWAAPLLEGVFDSYGITWTVSRRVPLGDAPLGRGLQALARCAWAEDAHAGDVLAYLRTPGVLERPEIADALELGLRQAGAGTAADARERLGWNLGEIDGLARAEDPAAELGRQARRLFAAPHRGLAPALDAREELDARALAVVLGGLDELAELGVRPSPGELLELLDELEVPAGRAARPGAVLLADPLAIRARRFRTVFVVGLQEGAFPLPAAPDPFLSDERRREIAHASGLRLALSDETLARERYLFYACASRATDELVLSYRSSDEEGNLELRSPFLADVEDLFTATWIERRERRLLADVVWPPDAAPTERERARAAAAAGSAAAGEPAPATRQLGAAALGHVRHAEIVSAGALEGYAACPVAWLIERQLEPERFAPNPDPMARGSFMHDVMEQLIARLGGPVRKESLPRAHEILDELLAESPVPVAPGRPEPIRNGALAAIAADLRRYLAHEAAAGSGWRTEGLELRFGFDEDSLPALELGDGVRLRGLIDRVDVDPSTAETGAGEGAPPARAIVTDYKTGRIRPEYRGDRWNDEDQLQVALYMLAVQRLLGLQPVAGMYQPLSGGDLRPRGVYLRDAPVGGRLFDYDARDQDQLDEQLEQARARAVELAERLRSGELTPCPRTCSPDGCRHPGICRSQ